MHYPPQTNRASNPHVKLPLKFIGGFGIDVSFRTTTFEHSWQRLLTTIIFQSDRIGLLFTFYGICGMFIQFLVFPPAARYFGVLNCLKAVTMTFPVVYVVTPFTALLPNQLAQQIGMFAIMLMKCWAAIFAFPCSTILLTNSASSLRILGTLNGVSTSISALGRAAGPAIGGLTFSYGVVKGYVILPWWTLAAFAVLGAIPVWWLVEMEGFGGCETSDSEDDDDKGMEEEALLTENEEVQRSTTIRIGVESPSEGSKEDSLAIGADMPNQLASYSNGHPHWTSAKRMSSPIGLRESVGPGGGTKLSNGLGHSHSGFGAGGSSYH